MTIDQSQAVVSAHGLRKTYGAFVAVDDIDFDIYVGECFGFLGPNGAGKTSTMRMIYGFNAISAGKLNVLSMDATSQLQEIKQRLGVVPQEDNLDPDLKVFQNLTVYARYFNIPKQIAMEKAETALRRFQLLDKRDRFIRELSGGMKRRLVIARSLINSPDILLADEPTTGLDPQARRLVWQQFDRLKGEGLTIVLTTHYMEEAAQLCDRIAIMDKGKILAIDSPTRLIEQYVCPEVIEARLPQGASALADMLAQRDVQHEVVGDTVYAYLNHAPQLQNEIEAFPGIERLVLRKATLEDVFLTLTGHGLED